MTNFKRLCERFTVECYATSQGFGLVVMSGEHLIRVERADLESAAVAVLEELGDDTAMELRGLEFATTYAHRLSAVERATPRITGSEDEPREDVAAHTLSLALAVIANGVPGTLKFADVLIYAIVHDLVEAECGDTDTSAWTEEIEAAKAIKEAVGLNQLLTVAPPEIAKWVRRYERQADPESRFVRILDKILPKVVRRLGGEGMLISHADGVAQAGRLRAAAPEEWIFLEALFFAALGSRP